MPLNEILPKAQKLYPGREAVVCGNIRYDYQTFANRIRRLSNALYSLGIRKNDRVAILHENCHVFLETYFAAVHAGLILVPINIRLSSREIADIIKDCQPKILITQGLFHDKIMNTHDLNCIERIIWTKDRNNIPGKVNIDYESFLAKQPDMPQNDISQRDDDVAHLYYTSGTTGLPKAVMLTHKNVKSHALGAIAEFHLTDRDHWLHAAPLFHLADAWAAFAITWAGGKHVLIPSFDAGEALGVIQSERITITNLIPTMLNMMVNHPDVSHYNYSSLRVLLSGGAPIAPETVRKIIEIFKCDYIQTYGMTETSPYLTLSILKEDLKSLPREEQLKYKASTGREFITVSLKVVNDQGMETAKDNREVGEIIVKGDNVTPGYWNRPEETQKAFRNGWLMTGDLAVINEEEYVTIVDRKKDMIITGGENVYSTEVENILYMHPDVLEAAVIGIPDEHWGEIVTACVVRKKESKISDKEIISFCKDNLTHYKAPKQIKFMDALPKTGSGKIYKKGLREDFLK